MTNRRITAPDMRRVLAFLDDIRVKNDIVKRCADLTTAQHIATRDISVAEILIRDILLNACITDVEVEPAQDGRAS